MDNSISYSNAVICILCDNCTDNKVWLLARVSILIWAFFTGTMIFYNSKFCVLI